SEFEIFLIFVGKRGNADDSSRKVDPLVFPQNAAVNDLAFHVFALDGANAQLNEAIGEQDARARLNLPGERFKGRGNQRACAGNLARSNRDPGARLESDRSAVFQTSSADFGALKVLENADRFIFRD